MMRILILEIIAISSISAIEDPIPSSFLQPRDFNPHPYQEDTRGFVYSPSTNDLEYQNLAERDFAPLIRRYLDTGPILFPENNDDQPQQNPQQQLEQQKRVISHIVQNQALIPHPYERLALNYRAQQLQRFAGGNDNQIPQIYTALANHARKVNSNELQRQFVKPKVKQVNRHDVKYLPDASEFDKKRYRFSYAVKDGLSGDDFSHTQNQENGAVHGSYKVHLPDGRVQVVKYTADDVHGYRADVSYEGEAHGDQVQLSAPIHVQPKAAVFRPIINPSVAIASGRHTSATPSPIYVQTHSIQAPNARKYFRATTLRPIQYYK